MLVYFWKLPCRRILFKRNNLTTIGLAKVGIPGGERWLKLRQIYPSYVIYACVGESRSRIGENTTTNWRFIMNFPLGWVGQESVWQAPPVAAAVHRPVTMQLIVAKVVCLLYGYNELNEGVCSTRKLVGRKRVGRSHLFHFLTKESTGQSRLISNMQQHTDSFIKMN